MSAIQFDLDSSSARMTGGAMLGGVAAGDTILRTRQVAPGRHRVLIYSRTLSSLEGSVQAGTIPFAVAAGDLTGGGPVRITNPLASTTNGTPVSFIRRLSGGVLVGPEQSADLRRWSPVATNQAIPGGWNVEPDSLSQSQAGSSVGFFRVRE